VEAACRKLMMGAFDFCPCTDRFIIEAMLIMTLHATVTVSVINLEDELF
jgi:hypothetical protein